MAFTHFDEKVSQQILKRVTENIDLLTLEHLLGVLRFVHEIGKFNTLVTLQVGQLPNYFTKIVITDSKKKVPATVSMLQNLLWFQEILPQGKDWVEKMSKVLTNEVSSEYIKKKLLTVLLETSKSSDLSKSLLQYCKEYLQNRIDNPPQAPADWSKPVPESQGHKNQWNILRAFLESPDLMVLDYREKQYGRKEMESAISSVVIDLKMETIKQGSPHILRITKTQTAYLLELKIWKEERLLLNEVHKKMKT